MKKTSRKVVIVGTGFVGTSIAYAMINQGISNELVLIDVNQEKAEGEALDLLDGMAWGDENVAVWSGGYEECRYRCYHSWYQPKTWPISFRFS